MRTVAESWRVIAAWYAKVQDPEDYVTTLSHGASEVEIATAEAAFGMALPDDVKESYRLHNGSYDTPVFPYAQALLTLEQAADAIAVWQKILDEGWYEEDITKPKGPIRPVHWNPKWLPISGIGSGNHHCVDMDPAPGGVIGQIIRFKHEYGPVEVCSDSFRAFLSTLADDLLEGKYRWDKEDCWICLVDEEGKE